MAFVKGKSGNPSGRPKTLPFKEALNVALKRVDHNDRVALHEIANKLVELALDGDLGAIKECADRMDGKARQAVDMDHDVTDSLGALLERLSGSTRGIPTFIADDDDKS